MLSTGTDIEVRQIPISKIKVINRMRRTDENNVEDLKRSIKEIGLLHPVCVAKKDDGYLCLSGLHRITAMSELGEEYISATVREDDELINQLVEIEENIVSKKIDSISESKAIVLREEILVKLGKKAVVGSNQYTENKITNDDLSRQLGYTRRTYQYKKAISKMHPDAQDLLCETKHANNMMDMYKLTTLEDHLQIEIARLLVSGKARTFKRAWILGHLKFKEDKWDDDKKQIKQNLELPKSIMRFDRANNMLNDICYFTSHNEDAIVTKTTSKFGTNKIKNYTICPEQSRWFINYFSKKGDLVCDPFAGSGTNLIAAAYENRKVIGYDLSPLNLQLIKTACLENTNIKEEDLKLHHSDGVTMDEYKEASNMIDLFLTDPPYLNAEDYQSNDDRDLCYSKDLDSFNLKIKECMMNMKRLIKPSNWKSKTFKPIIIKCGSIRKSNSVGLIDIATEIEMIGRELSLTLHDKIYNELRSSTQHYNVGRCIENRYTIKSHECNLVFLKYE